MAACLGLCNIIIDPVRVDEMWKKAGNHKRNPHTILAITRLLLSKIEKVLLIEDNTSQASNWLNSMSEWLWSNELNHVLVSKLYSEFLARMRVTKRIRNLNHNFVPCM